MIYILYSSRVVFKVSSYVRQILFIYIFNYFSLNNPEFALYIREGLFNNLLH